MAKIKDCPGFETFGEDVRAAREALGLTIKALAEQVGTDLPPADRTLFQP